MAQRLFIFKNNFLSECLQGRRLLCQFSAVGCTNMTASSSLSDFAASIFIVSPYCEVYPIFSKNTPLQHPLSVYQRKPFCECKSRYSFFPSSFSPLPLLPLPLPPPPLVCVCVSVCQMMSILKRNVASECMSKSIWAPASWKRGRQRRV